MNYLLQPVYFAAIVLLIYLAAVLYRSFCSSKTVFSLPLALITSTAGLIVLVFWLSFLGLNMRQIVYPVAGFFFLIFLIQLFRKKIVWIKPSGRDVFRLCVALCSALIYLIPIIVKKSMYFYGDQSSYVCMADYFRDNSYLSEPAFDEFSAWLNLPYFYWQHGLRVGSQLFLSFWAQLFHVELSIELFAPCMAVGVFLTTIAAWFFGENFTEKLDEKTIDLITIMAAFNTTIVSWSASTGLMPQIFGFALGLTVISLFIDQRKFKKTTHMHVVFGLITAALVLAYNELFLFVVCGMFFFLLWQLAARKSDRIQIIKCVAGDVVVSLLFCVVYIPNFFKAVINQLTFVVGYEVPIDWLKYAGYFFSTIYVNGDYKNAAMLKENLFFAFMTIFLLTLFLYGVVYCIKHRKMVGEAVAISTPYILLGLYYLFIAKNPYREGAIGNSWSIYKIVQYCTVVMIPYTGYFIATAFDRIRFKKILTAVCGVWIVSNIVYAMQYGATVASYAYTIVGNSDNPSEEYYALREKYKDYGGRIYVKYTNPTNQWPIAYFLKEHEISTCWCKGPAEYDGEGIILTYDVRSEDRIANMVETDVWIDDNVKDFYDIETSGEDTWRWVQGSRDSELSVTPEKPGEYIVEFELSTLQDEADVTVYLDSQAVYSGRIGYSDTTKISFPLNNPKVEEHLIRIEYGGEGHEGINGDTRSLAYRLINFKVSHNADAGES